MKKELEGTISPEQIEELKAKHGDVYAIGFTDCIMYVRRPNRKELSYIMTLQNDPLQMGETFIKTCKIAGSDKPITHVGHLVGAIEQMEGIMEVQKATLLKL